MIDINVPNFITIGVIAIASYALVKFGQRAIGVNLI